MRNLLVVGILLSAPLTATAQAEITEIMYDLPGTDTGREWVEVHNTGSGPLDLSAWKLFESETNHGLTHVSGPASVSSGGYAVLADDATAFAADYPDFTGTLFDSAFSLSNTGETISLKNGDSVIDTRAYSSASGGMGDGTSLQLASGSWVAGNPSPGASRAGSAAPAQEEETEESEAPAPLAETASESGGAGGDAEPLIRPTKLSVAAGSDRTVLVGAGQFYEAMVRDGRGDEIEHATVVWNFGNGIIVEGEKVFYAYAIPGRYVVSVKATSPDERLTAHTRFTVTAEVGKVFITAVTPTSVTVENRGGRELNLSHWSLRSGERHFLFPEDTIILPGASVTFSSRVMGLARVDTAHLALVYPSGMTAAVPRFTAPEAPRSFASSPRPRVASVDTLASSPQTVKVQTAAQTADIRSTVHNSGLPVAAVVESGSASLVPWLLGLLSVLVAGLTALFILRNRMHDTVDGYTIIEDDTDTHKDHS